MAGKAISELIAKENDELQKLNLCTNCQWVSKVGLSNRWKCKHPNHMQKNYVEGIIEFYPTYCDIKNVNGKCHDYERDIHPSLSVKDQILKQVLNNAIEKPKNIGFWKIIWASIKQWLFGKDGA